MTRQVKSRDVDAAHTSSIIATDTTSSFFISEIMAAAPTPIGRADHVRAMVKNVLLGGYPKNVNAGRLIGARPCAVAGLTRRSAADRRSTPGDGSGSVCLRGRLCVGRLFDVPAAQALEARIHPDHVHAALRTGRSDFKASQGTAPRWADRVCPFPQAANAE